MRLLIDPGHGGADHRGTEHGGLVESDYVLDLAYELSRIVSELGIESTLTRFGDVETSLYERGRICREYGADLVLSLHVNAGPPTLRGLITFSLDGDFVGAAVARAIARAAPDRLARRGQSTYIAEPDDWTSRAHAVLHPHRPTPAVLVELGFATSDADRDALLDAGSSIGIISALLVGVGHMRARLLDC